MSPLARFPNLASLEGPNNSTTIVIGKKPSLLMAESRLLTAI